jgi:hypothetical protein
MIEINVYRKTKEQLSLSDILYEGGQMDGGQIMFKQEQDLSDKISHG